MRTFGLGLKVGSRAFQNLGVLPRQRGTPPPETSDGGGQRAQLSVGRGTESASRQPLNRSPRFPVRAFPGNSDFAWGPGSPERTEAAFPGSSKSWNRRHFSQGGEAARKVEGFTEGAVHTAALKDGGVTWSPRPSALLPRSRRLVARVSSGTAAARVLG